MLLAAVLGFFLQTPFTDLTRHASIIFSGRVEKPQSATAGLPASGDTAIVRVDEVLFQPATLKRLEKQSVTVRFKKGEMPSGGQQAVFFTTFYAGGKSIGLDAAGVVRDLAPADARAALAKARDAILDEDIAARLKTSPLVVAGTVRAVKKLEVREWISEHDPEWAAAEVAVETSLKGTLKTATIYFASSPDALYAHWAKLKEGTRVIVIAQQSDPRLRIAFERSRLKPEGPFVVDRADVQPAAELERVRRLIR